MNEEIALHIEMETGRLMREPGLDRDAARRQVLVAFGGIAVIPSAARNLGSVVRREPGASTAESAEIPRFRSG